MSRLPTLIANAMMSSTFKSVTIQKHWNYENEVRAKMVPLAMTAGMIAMLPKAFEDKVRQGEMDESEAERRSKELSKILAEEAHNIPWKMSFTSVVGKKMK